MRTLKVNVIQYTLASFPGSSPAFVVYATEHRKKLSNYFYRIRSLYIAQ